jgi:hypothetical protein
VDWIITAYAQFRQAQPMAIDLHRPWERPGAPGRLTPARVRRGFRNIRTKDAQLANAPKPGARKAAGLDEPPPRTPP